MEMKECENREGLSNCQKDIWYSWKTDLQNAPVPQSHYIEQQPMTYLSEGIPYGFAHTDYMLAQRDPNDYIELESGTGKIIINAHANAWKYTIDRYLNQYIHLRNLQDMYLGKMGYEKISFPYEVMEKYLNNRRASKSRKKELFIELTDFERLEQVGEASENSYLFPKLGIAACLNLFCQSLGTRPNATSEILTPRHDGICFEIEDAEKFVPAFGIEDYYFHECFTGISLSIEITSILLEVSQKEPNKVLWSNAFDAFCKKALPTIVSSSSLFTRNTVARLFFEQILLELTVNSYQWTDSTKPLWEDKKYWNELVDRASFHLKKLETIPSCYDVEKSKIDCELAYIKALLSEMKFPIDLVSYSNNPTHGLAVFCNEKHKYVADFLSELADLVTDGETRVGNRYRAEADMVFQMVHRKTKEAIRFVRDLYKYRENEQIEEIEIQDKLRPMMWEAYSAFANTDGGMIVLKRSLALRSSKIWVPEMYTSRKQYKKRKNKYGWWDQDASTIVEKILSIANDTQKISRNVLGRKDICVWELDGYEMIVVKVPPKKKKEDWIYIGVDPSAGMYIREKNENKLMPRN